MFPKTARYAVASSVEFHADAKSNLAVLHNSNDMTNLFRASNWVSSSHDSIVSRGVTTCAGMTAHTVLLAQTQEVFSCSA